MTSCKSAMKRITIDEVSYCNRLAIEIIGNIEDGEFKINVSFVLVKIFYHEVKLQCNKRSKILDRKYVKLHYRRFHLPKFQAIFLLPSENLSNFAWVIRIATILHPAKSRAFHHPYPKGQQVHITAGRQQYLVAQKIHVTAL